MPDQALTISAVAGLSAKSRGHALGLLALATAAQLTVFAGLQRRMKRTGGPGIIPLELAGSTERARTYATLQALACETAAEGLGRTRPRGAGGGGSGDRYMLLGGLDAILSRRPRSGD